MMFRGKTGVHQNDERLRARATENQSVKIWYFYAVPHPPDVKEASRKNITTALFTTHPSN
jgi:hypothetical protein